MNISKELLDKIYYVELKGNFKVDKLVLHLNEFYNLFFFKIRKVKILTYPRHYKTENLTTSSGLLKNDLYVIREYLASKIN